MQTLPIAPNGFEQNPKVKSKRTGRDTGNESHLHER